MRASRILLIGGGVTASLFVLARTDDGLIGAASLLIVLAAAAVTVGLLVDLAVASPRLRSWARRLWPRHHHRCQSCRRPMASIGAIWACVVCDRVPLPAVEGVLPPGA